MLVELVKDATGALVIPGGNCPFTAGAVENQHVERCIITGLDPESTVTVYPWLYNRKENPTHGGTEMS